MLNEKDLTDEQCSAIDRLYECDETLLIAKVGFGKAVVGLTALRELLDDGHVSRVLVLAPLKVAELTWGTEPAKWSHISNDSVAICIGTPKQRRAALALNTPIVVSNFENTKWVLENYGDQFDAVLFDEMSKLKAVGGTSFKVLRHWVKGLRWRCGMSATPLAEKGSDIYGQALLLDCGKAFGTRKEGFLQTYFYATDFQQRSWALKSGGAESLAAQLKALVYMADDASYEDALPNVADQIVRLELDEQGREHYSHMKNTSVIELDSTVVIAETAAVQYGKLFQISAGGLYDEDKNVVWTGQHKRNACVSFVKDCTSPIIIVYQFTFERDWLAAAYPDAPILGGGGKFTVDDLNKWNMGETPVLIMHPKSAAAGLNLQHGGNTMLFLSPVASADLWHQSIGRLRRRGSKFDCINRVVLVTANTVDEKVLDNLTNKKTNEVLLLAELA